MKKNILIYILLSQINILVAQDSCDPTLPICDSVFIDSIVFAELPSTGNHVIFQVTTEHHFLYAPNFVICSDSNIDFSNTDYGYFSIYGPEEISPLYGYTDIADGTFEGYMVVENSASALDNCIISFSTTIPEQSTSINNDKDETVIKILPNPVDDYLKLEITDDSVLENVFLIDVLGRKHEIKFTSLLIDMRDIPKGMYLLYLELDNGELFTRKILRKY